MAQGEFGNYLRLLRIKNSLTMTQTAELTGITQGYISQIENGIYTPSAKTLAKLARAYAVPEIHLLRKAGIVQMAGPLEASEAAAGAIDPLVEVSDARELVEMLRRSLASMEYLSGQLLQRAQLAPLPTAPTGDQELSAEMILPLFDASWQPLANATGEPAGMTLPAALCDDDPDAFILAAGDDAMAPFIETGDWVVISPAAKLEAGHVVAVNDRNQIRLRGYTATKEAIALMPLNPEHRDKALLLSRKKDKVELVGRVLRIVNRAL